jgi:hypothetical protein
MQIEEKEINNVTVQEPIGQIAEDAGQKQTESNAPPRIMRLGAQ